jgi:hypothetical protein
MEDKKQIESFLREINIEELYEVTEKSNKSNKYFDENFDKIMEKYAGHIVAVSSEKIASVPFTSDISEAKKNFEILEGEIGKENMGSAIISYIPKPHEILVL